MKPGIDYVGIFVCAFCHDGKGSYLFAKRGAGARDEQGKWNATPGGTLELTETIEESLLRELEEEIGTKPHEFEFIGHRDLFRNINGIDTHWIGFYFKALVKREEVKIMEPDVCEAHEWHKINDLPQPMISKFDETLAVFKDKL